MAGNVKRLVSQTPRPRMVVEGNTVRREERSGQRRRQEEKKTLGRARLRQNRERAQKLNVPSLVAMGAAAVAVHGRTREQYYSGKADWDIIRRVKEAVKIPVIGNGDVTSAKKAVEMRKQTGCDGVMVARGAQGNPWIFAELTAYERTGTLPPAPDIRQRKAAILRHARLLIDEKGDYLGIREMRKHVAWYTKGLPNAARMRGKMTGIASYEELENLLTSL